MTSTAYGLLRFLPCLSSRFREELCFCFTGTSLLAPCNSNICWSFRAEALPCVDGQRRCPTPEHMTQVIHVVMQRRLRTACPKLSQDASLLHGGLRARPGARPKRHPRAGLACWSPRVDATTFKAFWNLVPLGFARPPKTSEAERDVFLCAFVLWWRAALLFLLLCCCRCAQVLRTQCLNENLTLGPD